MNIVLRATVAAAAVLSAPVLAQDAKPVEAAPSTMTPIVAVPKLTTATTNALPANTELWLSPNAEVNSKRIKQGAKFDMTVARDVMLGDYVVIPRGARGKGQITFRTGKGAFGKSAKMEFEISELELNGQFIPLRGHYRIEGGGNTGATVGTAVAVGPFAAFVTGRSAIVAQGTEYKAFTVNLIPVKLANAPAEPLAPQTAQPAALVPSTTSAPAAKSTSGVTPAA